MGKHVVVIGGGFAGASAASYLTEKGYSVTLLEKNPTLGGRTSSFRNQKIREDVDRGQYFFWGGYHEALRFLKRLKVENRLSFTKNLLIPFLSVQKGQTKLHCGSLPFSWGLLAGLFGYKELSFMDRLSLWRAIASIRFFGKKDLSDMTVSEWLDKMKQTPGARRAFWEPFCYGFLNENPEVAAAEPFRDLLRYFLMGHPSHRPFGFSTVAMSKLWAVDLPSYLKRQRGVVAPSQRVTGFEVKNRRVTKVILDGGETGETDAVISCVPLQSFLNICPKEIRPHYKKLENTSFTGMITVHLWLDSSPTEERYLRLLDSPFHWFFNHTEGRASKYISLVMNNVNGNVSKSDEDLVQLASRELKSLFPGFKGESMETEIVRELGSIPSVSPSFWRNRPSVTTPFENFFIAGDWVHSGFPATIESACASGHRAGEAARIFLESLERAPKGDVYVKSGSV